MLTSFGKEFRKFRVDNNITFAHLKMKFGKSITFYSKIENGILYISDTFLEEICKSFGLPDKEINRLKLLNKSYRFSKKVFLDGLDENQRMFFYELLTVYKDLTNNEIEKIRGIISSKLKRYNKLITK